MELATSTNTNKSTNKQDTSKEVSGIYLNDRVGKKVGPQLFNASLLTTTLLELINRRLFISLILGHVQI